MLTCGSINLNALPSPLHRAGMGKNCLVNYLTNFTEANTIKVKDETKYQNCFSNILTKLKIRHFVWFSEPSNPSLQFVNASDVIFKYIKRGFGCIDGMTAKFHLSKICISKFAQDARFRFCLLKNLLKRWEGSVL